ncbi:glycosyltransferase [Marinimicrobium alkaliphilum]|uniref:glycosyltransferase n=1 Tax=Marinimicrobium alkaliphilum TaxID=2202654 RepID=UPI00130016E9|nr:glycosyltransferase family 2 protein [Marinimicrobium alkaliphilum]
MSPDYTTSPAPAPARLFISVVSHHNAEEIINALQPHRFVGPHSQVILLDNRPEKSLAHYAADHQLHYLRNEQPQGFGANHNRVFRHCCDHLGLVPERDVFLVVNPDVVCGARAPEQLAQEMLAHEAAIGAPNLFKDEAMTLHEQSVRRFPYLWDLLPSFLMRRNRTGIDRARVTEPVAVDWASGACLAIRGDVFRQLDGFDERYFLYYEDVDLCWRARRDLQVPVWYFPSVKLVHTGKRASHGLFNRHLWWHLSSALRFARVRHLGGR